MNITLTGTKIKQDTKLLAFEKNNNVDVINITVDTDESWTYKLDVKYPACSCGDDKYNIIDLMRNGKQLSVMLTSAMLPFAGRYQCQLRGISGDKVYHTDTFDVWVKRSIEPGKVYNPVPSEFYQIEKNITEMNNNPPYPSDDGYWMIWDVDTEQYVKSDIKAAAGQGAVRYDIAQGLTEEQRAQARENIGVLQDDWQQNDATKPDYVKNRPGGYDIVTEGKEVTVEITNDNYRNYNPVWVSRIASAQHYYCKISDTPLTYDQMSNATCNGESYPVYDQGNGYYIMSGKDGVFDSWDHFVYYGIAFSVSKSGQYPMLGTVDDAFIGTYVMIHTTPYGSTLLGSYSFVYHTLPIITPQKIPAKYLDVETDFVLAHVTTNEDGTYSSDKTYDELREAFEAGKIVGLVPPGDLGYWQDFRAFSNTPFLYLLGTLKGNNIVKLSFAAFAPAPDPSPIFEGGIIYIAFSCTFSPTEITFNPQEITTKLPQIYNFDVTESNGVISSVTTYNQIAQIISLYDTDESDYGYNVRGIANLQATFGGVLYGFVSIDSSKKTAVFSATTKSGVEKLIVTNDGTTDTWTHTVENLSLPTATSTTLGGVKPVTKTDEMTQDVGVDENGKLYTEPTKDGKDGADGTTPTIGENGNWYLGTEDTGKPSRGEKGDPGDAGTTPNIQIGTVTTLAAGSDATASIGGTAENPLLNLGIPQGEKGDPGGGSGGTDISLGITGASAGQIAKITAVDENGVPTAWEPADMPSGGGGDGEMGELLLSAEASDVAAFSQSFDTKNYDKFLFFIGGTKASAAISINNGKFFTDGMWFTICYYTGWLDATNTSYPDGCIVQTLERVTDDFASVTYNKVPTALAPIRSTFQGNSSQFASPKRGYLQGVTNETPDGIALQFSGTVSYVKIAVYGYH